MGQFVADSVVQARVAAALKRSGGVADVTGNVAWPVIITAANTAAYNEIVTRLTARGFSAAQIAAWDRGVEYETKIALYWSLLEGGALDGYDDRSLREMKAWIKELDTVQVLNAGAWQKPGNIPGPGTVGTGRMDTGLDDPRVGRVESW